MFTSVSVDIFLSPLIQSLKQKKRKHDEKPFWNLLQNTDRIRRFHLCSVHLLTGVGRSGRQRDTQPEQEGAVFELHSHQWFSGMTRGWRLKLEQHAALVVDVQPDTNTRGGWWCGHMSAPQCVCLHGAHTRPDTDTPRCVVAVYIHIWAVQCGPLMYWITDMWSTGPHVCDGLGLAVSIPHGW